MILGEAAWRLSEDAKSSLAEVPWPKIIGLRHRLVHAYDEVDFDVIWETMRRDVPNLIVRIGPAIPPDSEREGQ
jgi:uncharacterized protein with HEPN domain